jgi:hypothetical protein
VPILYRIYYLQCDCHYNALRFVTAVNHKAWRIAAVNRRNPGNTAPWFLLTVATDCSKPQISDAFLRLISQAGATLNGL